MRGVQLIAAMTLVAELQDFLRFENPRQLMAYVGLVPGEHSSGPKRRQGSITKITKAGNERCAAHAGGGGLALPAQPQGQPDHRHAPGPFAQGDVLGRSRREAKTTVGQVNLTLRICRAIAIPLPPLAEQHRIVTEADRRLSLVRVAEARFSTNLARAQRLRQFILRRAFAAPAPHWRLVSRMDCSQTGYI